jgi:hypothetical protein
MPTEPMVSRVVLEGLFRKCESEIIKIIGLLNFCGGLFRRGFEDHLKERADLIKW